MTQCLMEYKTKCKSIVLNIAYNLRMVYKTLTKIKIHNRTKKLYRSCRYLGETFYHV